MPVVVIGAGFAGVGAAAVLDRAGHRVLVLDRAPTVGGAGPGHHVGCPCPGGPPRAFPSAVVRGRRAGRPPDERAYLQDVVRRCGLGDRIRCGVTVEAAVWDEAAQVWRLRTSAGPVRADVLVGAWGRHGEPVPPDLPGEDAFGGTVLRAGPGSPDAAVTDRRVAIVGTGACAVRLVPHLAGAAAELTVLQRTPPWVLPRRARLAAALARRPVLARVAERRGLAHLRRQVPDPGLRALLTPTYRAAGPRVLRSDDYYPALCRDTVELVPHAAARLEPGTVVAADGTRRAADVVVLATGSLVPDPPTAHHVHGRDGQVLAEAWHGSGGRGHGTTVPGFPNLFLLHGAGGRQGPGDPLRARLARLRHALAPARRSGPAAVRPRTEVPS